MEKNRKRLIFVQHLSRMLKIILHQVHSSVSLFCMNHSASLAVITFFLTVVPILFVAPWGISRSKLENTG